MNKEVSPEVIEWAVTKICNALRLLATRGSNDPVILQFTHEEMMVVKKMAPEFIRFLEFIQQEETHVA